MKNQIIKTFAIRALILYGLWVIIYYGYIQPNGRLNEFLTYRVVAGTVFGLDVLGYQTDAKDNIVHIKGEPVVLVGDACNGLELFALYSGFLLAFPGKKIYKAFFIPVGILIIYVINVIREIALSLNYKFFRESFEINHKYTYVFIVYVAVFLIWRFWLKNYSILASRES